MTTDDVVRAARSYLMESNRTAGLFIPTKEPVRAPIPKTPDVSALVATYEGTETIEQGEAFEATPDTALAAGTGRPPERWIRPCSSSTSWHP